MLAGKCELRRQLSSPKILQENFMFMAENDAAKCFVCYKILNKISRAFTCKEYSELNPVFSFSVINIFITIKLYFVFTFSEYPTSHSQ